VSTLNCQPWPTDSIATVLVVETCSRSRISLNLSALSLNLNAQRAISYAQYSQLDKVVWKD